jgi:hypothetical protein
MSNKTVDLKTFAEDIGLLLLLVGVHVSALREKPLRGGSVENKFDPMKFDPTNATNLPIPEGGLSPLASSLVAECAIVENMTYLRRVTGHDPRTAEILPFTPVERLEFLSQGIKHHKRKNARSPERYEGIELRIAEELIRLGR